jgi:hypothetical protein
MDKKIPNTYGKSDLEQYYERDSYHKFLVLGLVPDDLHGNEHGNRATDKGEGEKPCLGRAVAGELLCGDLVIASNYDGNKGDRGKINVGKQRKYCFCKKFHRKIQRGLKLSKPPIL